MRLARMLVWAAIALGGCAGRPGMWMVRQHPYTMRIDPPPVYRTWWKQMKNCAGKHRNRFDQVEFWMVEYDSLGFFIEGSDNGLAGIYDPKANRIYMDQKFMFDRRLVGHEMIHAIGVVGHPQEIFVAQCGVFG